MLLEIFQHSTFLQKVFTKFDGFERVEKGVSATCLCVLQYGGVRGPLHPSGYNGKRTVQMSRLPTAHQEQVSGLSFFVLCLLLPIIFLGSLTSPFVFHTYCCSRA